MAYSAVHHVAGDAAVSSEWNDISDAVARIDTTISPVAASVYTTAQGNVSNAQSGTGAFPAGRYYAVFNTVEKDTPGGMVNLGGGGNSAKVITITASGLYLLFGMSAFSSAATPGTFRTISIDKGGDPTQILSIYQLPPVSGAGTYITVTGMTYLNAGDTIALRLDQNSGSNPLTTTAIGASHIKLACSRISS